MSRVNGVPRPLMMGTAMTMHFSDRIACRDIFICVSASIGLCIVVAALRATPSPAAAHTSWCTVHNGDVLTVHESLCAAAITLPGRMHAPQSLKDQQPAGQPQRVQHHALPLCSNCHRLATCMLRRTAATGSAPRRCRWRSPPARPRCGTWPRQARPRARASPRRSPLRRPRRQLRRRPRRPRPSPGAARPRHLSGC
jgi:hypothetical protein